MWKTWMTLFGNPPTDLMYEFGDRLQQDIDRDILMGFRGLSKSYITVTRAVHRLYVDPTEIVLTVSGSDGGAKGNAALAYSFINTFDWLAHMKPSGSLRQASQAFDVRGSRMEKSESFAAMSLFGQITGRRASYIIPDDVETPNTSGTEADRKELRTRYAELGGAILKPGGQITVLGTAQTEQTLYLELARDKGYSMWMCPVVYPRIDQNDPKKDEIHKYGPWLAPFVRKAVEANPALAGTPVEPTRFDESDLFARKLEYGTTEFDRQFKLFLDAGADKSTKLKIKDIPCIEIAPGPHFKVPAEFVWSPMPANKLEGILVDSLNEDSTVYAPTGVGAWQEPEGKVLIVDPSGGGSDETAWGVLAQHVGALFLVDIDGRLEGFSAETMLAIAECAKRWGVYKIIIEKNYGGGMFGELLRPILQTVGHPCTIEEEVAGQVQKEVRIVDTLEAIVTDHRLVIAAEVLRKDFKVEYASVEATKAHFYRLTYQLTRITKVRGCLAHDDRIDMLATGAKAFLGSLSRERSKAAQESVDAELARQAEKIIEARRKQGLPLFGLEQPDSRLGGLQKVIPGGVTGSPLFFHRHR